MKKRILTAIVFVLIMFNLTACTLTETTEATDNTPSSTFVEIEDDGYWRIVYHRKTKVMYVVNEGRYGSTFTLLVREDGSPMLYEE